MKPQLADYSEFTEAQFASDEFFQQWILLPEKGHTTFWDAFLEAYPHQRSVVLSARQLVTDLGQSADLSADLLMDKQEKKLLKQDILQQLHVSTPTNGEIKLQKKWPWMAIAAVLFALVAIPVYLLIKPSGSQEKEIMLVKTGAQEIKEVLLPDSSVIILNGNSSIKYAALFLEKEARNVSLEGNAFFKVKKRDDKKPFIVTTNAVSVSVLGTQFNVNARTNAPEIVLTSGSVKVSINGQKQGTYMNPGERVILDTLSNSLTKSLEDGQYYSAWSEGKWNFQETSLEKITELISEYYGVDVVFENENSRLLKMSAVLPVGSLQTLQNIIASTLHLDITETKNQMIIR